jgi:hypothetical protein
MSEKSPIIPILAGAGGAIVATLAAEKVGLSPNTAAWGTAAVGAATALGTKGVVRQVATGVGAGGACLGALSLVGSVQAKKHEQTVKEQHAKRQADGQFVTHEQLNDALTKVADGTKQANCDLLAALDDRIVKIVDAHQKALPQAQPQRLYYLPPRGASFFEDEYMRNAYGGEVGRNAYVEDEYMRNAYGSEEERNAYVEEERNAYPEEERNAYVEEERNAYVEEERNAEVEERNAEETA